MAEDQTLEETLTDTSKEAEETSEETAVEKETQPEKTTEPEVDYKVKFQESQKEAVRLYKELKDLKGKTVSQPVETVETETGGETLDQIVEKKVREKIAPLTKQQEEERVDKWLGKNPGAYDYLKEIEDNWQNIPGKTTEEKLENSFLLAKKDAMKQAGKKEMAFSIYQKEQASTSGGASVSVGESLPDLSEEEKKVAQAFGIKEEVYAKSKVKK
jgi:hypothetical protein